MIIERVVEGFASPPLGMALGISSLESIAAEEFWPKDGVQVAVPDNLVRLLRHIQEGSREHLAFLSRLTRYFNTSYRWNKARSFEGRVVYGLVESLARLEASGCLVVLDESIVDEDVAEAFSGVYRGDVFQIALSPVRNFVRDYLVRVYSWSKRSGGVIVERTRRVFSDMGHHVATLQLPDRIDAVVDLKSKYVKRFFSLQGGKGAKFFVGLAISVAGLGNPLASGVGVLIAFADP